MSGETKNPAQHSTIPLVQHYENQARAHPCHKCGKPNHDFINDVFCGKCQRRAEQEAA